MQNKELRLIIVFYGNMSIEYLGGSRELTLPAEPLVVRVDDCGIDDGGVAELMVP